MRLFYPILTETWQLLLLMAPYLLLGFILAGLLRFLIPPETIAKHLGHSRLSAIFNATLIGIPMPLCSCGVLPAAMGLRKSGASMSATMAFLVSTPSTGVDSILATYGILGGVFTLFRVIATLICGLVVGGLCALIPEPSAETSESKKSHCCASETTEAESMLTSGLGTRFRQAMHFGLVEMIEMSGISILVGLLLGGMIGALFPDGAFPTMFASPLWSMLLALVIGVPMYVCSTGSLPVVAMLLAKGLHPAAGLVFLIVGPATNTVTLAMIGKEFGGKILGLFLIGLTISAIGVSLLAYHILGLQNIPFSSHHHETGPALWMEWSSALILLALILGTQIHRIRHRRQ